MITYAACPKCQRLNRVSLSGGTDGKKPVCGACQVELPVHGALVEASGEGLSKLIAKSPLPVVVDFWAPWCGPCRVFAPTFEQVAQELAGSFVFVKLNTEAHPSVGDRYQIRSIPTLAVFKNGQEFDRKSGAMGAQPFKAWLLGR